MKAIIKRITFSVIVILVAIGLAQAYLMLAPKYLNKNSQATDFEEQIPIPFVEGEQAHDPAYQKLLQEYKVVKLKRLIAKDKEAIALAKLNTVETKLRLAEMAPNEVATDQVVKKAPKVETAAPAISPVEQKPAKPSALINFINNKLFKSKQPTEEIKKLPDHLAIALANLQPAAPLEAAAEPPKPIKLQTTKPLPLAPVQQQAAIAPKAQPPKLKETPKPKVVAKAPVAAKPVITKPIAKKVLPKVINRTYTASEKHLLAINPKHYTVQLMTNTDINKIKKFVAANNIADKTYIYKTFANQKPWYVLLYGEYASSQQALTTITQLPIQLQRWSPMVRRFDLVQTELGKNFLLAKKATPRRLTESKQPEVVITEEHVQLADRRRLG